ncbi:hypothetical protein CBL_11745 [Carabus blaptoides fortunei]
MIFRSAFKILRSILPIILENSGSIRHLSYQHGPETAKISTAVTDQLHTQITQRRQLQDIIGPFRDNSIKIVTNLPPAQSPLNCGRPGGLLTTRQLDHSQKRTLTEAARNSAIIREKYKCDEKKQAKKLAFRQTTKEECEECVDRPEFKDCKLQRLKRAYDPTKLKWDHTNCPKEPCPYYAPKMDDNLKPVGRKTLPVMAKPSDCIECEIIPTKAPPLGRPKRAYDPTKMKRDDTGCRGPLCNIDPERLDDINCWIPTKKILPSM